MGSDSRERFFTGKIQKQLFCSLVLQGSLRLEDVRLLYGSRELAEKFVVQCRAVGVARLEFDHRINGLLVYTPDV